MPLLIQCPNPECRNRATVSDALSGQSVKCKKCQTSFAATPTHGGDSSETKGSRPASTGEPFVSLPAEFGRYRVLKKLGQGGMGAVYLAEDTHLSRRVALKLPSFDASETTRVERFVREAKAAAGLMHANICPVFDAGTIDGKPFISMGYIDGKPLADTIDPESPVEPRRAAEIVRTIALALREAHDKGIVHRDLKPANVMLNARGEPVVMDFGLAKRVAEVDPHEAKLTRDGAVLGTPSYMAPEQVKGEQQSIGPATDVYALGVMLFELLTGRTPYEGTLGVVMGRILTAPVPPVSEFRPDVDPRLDAVCRKAMAKEPGDRYPGMAAFAAALSEAMRPVSAKPRSSVPAPFEEMVRTMPALSGGKARPRSRAPLALAAGLFGLVIVLAGVVLTFKTKYGEVVIEIDDPQAKVEVKVDGDRIDIAGLEKPLSLSAGEHGLTVSGPDYETVTRQFAVKKGERQVVKVSMKPKPAVEPKPPEATGSTPPSESPPSVTSRKPIQIVSGDWKTEGNELVQRQMGRNLIFFGNANWTDYDFTFETKTDSQGSRTPQGGVALFRAEANDFRHYGFVMGTRGTHNELSLNQDGRYVREVEPRPMRFESDRWYRLKISLRGSKVVCELDGKTAFEHTDSRFPKGPVGLASLQSVVRFRDIKVMAPDGTVLWDGLPDVPAAAPASAVKPNRPVTDRKTARKEGGDWTINGTVLVQTKPGPAAVLFGDEEWTDYDFSFDTKTDGTPDQVVDGGVAVYRTQGFGNLHSFVLGAYQGKFTEVCRWQDSAWHRDVNPLNAPYHAGSWHKVLVKIRGDRFVCSLDDQVVFDYRDARFPKGGVGLRTWAPNVRYRNIRVVEPNGTLLWDGLPDIVGGDGPPDVTPERFDRTPSLVEGGDWKIEGRDLVQAKPENAKIFFGDKAWTDFDLTFESRTDAPPGTGAMGGRVLFRATDPNNAHRISFGAGGGTIHEISRFDSGTVNRDRPTVPTRFEVNQWYRVFIQVRGESIRCDIAGQTVFDYKDPLHTRGQIGLTTWNAACRWRDIKVTAPDGRVLWEGLPLLTAAKVGAIAPTPKAPVATVASRPLFNGKDLNGWKVDGASPTQWSVKDGTIVATSTNYVTRNYLLTEEDYSDFTLKFDFQVGHDQAHGGVALRAIPGEQVPGANGRTLFDHPLIKLTHPGRDSRDATGAAHWLRAAEMNLATVPTPPVTVGKWHKAVVTVNGNACVITFDGKPMKELKLDPAFDPGVPFVPGLRREKGKVGFQVNRGPMLYRNIEIQSLK